MFSCRYGSWSAELGEHLLPELFASGFSSMSIFHQVAGETFMFAFSPVPKRQTAVHHTAPASKRYLKKMGQMNPGLLSTTVCLFVCL